MRRLPVTASLTVWLLCTIAALFVPRDAFAHAPRAQRQVLVQAEDQAVAVLVSYTPSKGLAGSALAGRVAAVLGKNKAEAYKAALTSEALSGLHFRQAGKRVKPVKVRAKLVRAAGVGRELAVAVLVEFDFRDTEARSSGLSVTLKQENDTRSSLRWTNKASASLAANLVANVSESTWLKPGQELRLNWR